MVTVNYHCLVTQKQKRRRRAGSANCDVMRYKQFTSSYEFHQDWASGLALVKLVTIVEPVNNGVNI